LPLTKKPITDTIPLKITFHTTTISFMSGNPKLFVILIPPGVVVISVYILYSEL